MMKLSELKDKYAGRPAAVLGGGASLPEDIKHIPADSLLIAVNYHGFYYCEPHFMVYNDDPNTNPLQAQAVAEHRAVHVSPHPTSDVIYDILPWGNFLSSTTAAWFALWLGCEPVILCGMDCYQGEVKHCPPSTHDKPEFHQPLDVYLRPWVEEGRNYLPNPERLRAMSGPLTEVFGAYQWAS